MSIPAINWAYQQTDIPGPARAVLAYLCNRANDDLHCYPQVSTIVRDVGFGDRAVRMALNFLVQEGCIRRHRTLNSDGSMGQYEYWIEINREPKTEPETPKIAVEKVSRKHGPASNAAGRKTQKKHGAARDAAGNEISHKNIDRHEMPVGGAPARDAAGPPARDAGPIEGNHHSKNHHNKNTSENVEPSVLQNTFVEIWNLWPGQARVRSKSKRLCIEALKRALSDGPLPAMMVEAVRRYLRTIENPKYVPALERWLRDGRFEHFLPSAKIHELPMSASVDWRATLRGWFETGHWPRGVGPLPTERGYQGPLDALEALLPQFPEGHPFIRDIRRVIDARQTA